MFQLYHFYFENVDFLVPHQIHKCKPPQILIISRFTVYRCTLMYMYYIYSVYNTFEENWFFNMLNFLVRITLQINQKNEQPQILMILPIIFIACKIFGRKWLFNMLAQIWFNESISKCTYLSTYIHYIRQGTSFSFPKTDIIVKCTVILNDT